MSIYSNFLLMKTGEQIEVVIYKLENSIPKYLILKRTSQRGGFWQPVTGGIEVGESPEQAVERELKEELGIDNRFPLTNIYSFNFTEDGVTHKEYVYAIEADPSQVIKLSNEHERYLWLDENAAVEILKWPGNKEAIRRLSKILSR